MTIKNFKIIGKKRGDFMNVSINLVDVLKIFYYSYPVYWILESWITFINDKKFKRNNFPIINAKNMVVLLLGLGLNQVVFAVLSLFVIDEKILLSIFFAIFWIVFFVLNQNIKIVEKMLPKNDKS